MTIQGARESLEKAELPRLVDLEQGLVSREVFVNPEIYQQEQEQIFARCWLLVGHESLVPKPGDFLASSMGEEPVILVRDRQSRLHVFLNTCRHRGMKVCRYDQGSTAIFTCPYHGWGYGLDGALVGVPAFKDGYHEQLDKRQWGLIEVAQLATYKGTVWATWDPKAPPFLEYLGGMHLFLDLLLDKRNGEPGDSEVIGGVHKWRIPCNWKFGAENFVGDAYHAISHRSVDMIGTAPGGGKGRSDQEARQVARYSVHFPGLGHGTNSSIQLAENEPYTPIYENLPHLQDYLRECYQERQRRLGTLSRVLGGAATIFPNMSFQPRQPRTFVVWHPRGPGLTEAWRYYLIDADAPAELRQLMVDYHERNMGANGMTEQDDMENWNYATSASRGAVARRYPYNYQMGQGFERVDEGLPTIEGGVACPVPSEKNQRNYYARWLQLMDASGWAEIHSR